VKPVPVLLGTWGGGCPGGISCLPPLCTDMSHRAGGACARLSAAQHCARSLPGACKVEVVGLGAAGARRARGYSPCHSGIAALCTPDRVGLYRGERGEGGGGAALPHPGSRGLSPVMLRSIVAWHTTEHTTEPERRDAAPLHLHHCSRCMHRAGSTGPQQGWLAPGSTLAGPPSAAAPIQAPRPLVPMSRGRTWQQGPCLLQLQYRVAPLAGVRKGWAGRPALMLMLVLVLAHTCGHPWHPGGLPRAAICQDVWLQHLGRGPGVARWCSWPRACTAPLPSLAAGHCGCCGCWGTLGPW
jgi:hypothetical protein